MVRIHWGVIGITFGIALGSALVGVILKEASRTQQVGRKFSFTRDDWIVWTDWAILGGLAFILSVLAHNHPQPHQHLPTATYVWGFGLLIVSVAIFPRVFRAFAYDSDARVKGFVWIAVMDVAGGLLLAAAVQSGITVFDWSGCVGQ